MSQVYLRRQISTNDTGAREIEIRILNERNALRINTSPIGMEYLIEEIELGSGPHKKIIKYTTGFLKHGTECKAIIIAEGKIRIVQ